MKTIQPLPVEDIVRLSDLCRHQVILVDGYDGAAVLGALADQAAAILAHNPRRGGGDADETRMISYVTDQLRARDLHKNVYLGGYRGKDVYDNYGKAAFGAIIIDPDETDTDVSERVRAAAPLAKMVYLVDRREQFTYQFLGLGASHTPLSLVRFGITLVSIRATLDAAGNGKVA
jgi:hypothetical protein